MKKLDELYQKISEKNIMLFRECALSTLAGVIERGGTYGIFIDYKRIESEEQEFMLLAHEYGHCVSGAVHKFNSGADIIRKNECTAWRTAVLELLPYSEIEDAVKRGYTESWELAEEIGVPEAFLRKALEIYKKQGLIKPCGAS